MKAKPEDLQSSPVGHLGICPKRAMAIPREWERLREGNGVGNAFLGMHGARDYLAYHVRVLSTEKGVEKMPSPKLA